MKSTPASEETSVKQPVALSQEIRLKKQNQHSRRIPVPFLTFILIILGKYNQMILSGISASFLLY
jgi:hypothetical protein